MMKRMMESIGFTVSMADNGATAVEMLDDGLAVDLVLVDWNMPVMDGLQLIKHVRDKIRDVDTPMVMVTSESDPKQIARALIAGADEYLIKPIDTEMILGKLSLIGLTADVEANG
jgi:two-component system chemotaxis response regulator CheY